MPHWPDSCSILLQTLLFYIYGLVLRECPSVELVKKHLAGLLELSQQSSSQQEVGPQPWDSPLWLTQPLGSRWPGCFLALALPPFMSCVCHSHSTLHSLCQ